MLHIDMYKPSDFYFEEKVVVETTISDFETMAWIYRQPAIRKIRNHK